MSNPLPDPLIAFRNVSRSYGAGEAQVRALDNVSLTINAGEFVAIMGPSGSGKSTTLYIMAGFQDPTAGDIKLRGSSILSTRYVEPGPRVLVLQGPPGGAGFSALEPFELEVKPCMRYYIVALKLSPLDSNFKPQVDFMQPLAGCSP